MAPTSRSPNLGSGMESNPVLCDQGF